MNKLIQSLAKLQKEANRLQQRLFIVLSGSRINCNDVAKKIAESTPLNSIVSINTTNMKSDECNSNSDVRRFLGQNIDLLIYDTYAGFDPDAFGIMTGAICGGGLCILICPALSEWAKFKDPENKRITVHGYDAADVSGHYLERLSRIIYFDTHLIYKGKTYSCYILPLNVNNPPLQRELPTPDQKSIIADILELAQSNDSSSSIIITAGRGRGKSAAMGIAAGKIIHKLPALKLSICAPGRKNTEMFFKHLGAELTANDNKNDAQEIVAFHSPDALLKDVKNIDVLFVDEAAAIPLPLLDKIVFFYKKIIFCSTTHGYEGAGRGFSLRFKEIISRDGHTAINRTLVTPIRYAQDDPMESEINKLLMLDSQIRSLPQQFELLQENLHLEELSKNNLLNNELRLQEIFALLVQAHYQTKPLDLRHIMDGANLKCYILRQGDLVIGATLLAIEGSIGESSLAQCIIHGERRPRGHLLPQILSYQHLQPEYLSFNIVRVVRIVIHPELQRQGVGSILLKKLLDDNLKPQGVDAIGACFGDSDSLATFWTKNGFSILHKSNRKNASSGFISIVVLNSISRGAINAQKVSWNRYQRNSNDHKEWTLTAQDLEEINSYCFRRRDYEASEDALERFFTRHQDYLAQTPREIIKSKVLQRLPWGEVCVQYKLQGRRDCESHIKSAIKDLLIRNNLPDIPAN